jgi:hypothetical protein
MIALTVSNDSSLPQCSLRLSGRGSSAVAVAAHSPDLLAEAIDSHDNKNGKTPLNVINAKEGSEFCTIAAKRGDVLMILASHGSSFLISS